MIMENKKLPTTLQEAIIYFNHPDNALQFLATLRWPDGPECPHCGSRELYFLSTRRIWKCKRKECRKQFSVKVGTIFEDSPLGLDKWLPAAWLVINCKNGISSYELARDLKITQKSCWFMLHRIRLAMQTRSFQKLSGEVEVDESFLGGLARNMHARRRNALMRDPSRGKTAVMGLLERQVPDKGSRVRTRVLPDTSKLSMQTRVKQEVEPGSRLYTDEHASYKGLDRSFIHEFINHAQTYAMGRVHTNGLENFWSLLKRSLRGTYVSIEPFHLFRYLDEQTFRFNNRKLTDSQRFSLALSAIAGRRLTYQELAGKSHTVRP